MTMAETMRLPMGLAAQRIWVRWFGSLRRREQFLLLDRPHYAYGLFRAVDVARYFGVRKVAALEFGVAGGDGLANLAELGRAIGGETGIEIHVVGFDNGDGLPRVEGVRDHPEIWSPGDFSAGDVEALRRRMEGRAELVLGDVRDTIPAFLGRTSPDCPVGFAALDVDLYTSSVDALRCLAGPPELYLPAVSLYLDDVGFFFANRWCGELAAVSEFNAAYEHRKIDEDRTLPGDHKIPHASWYRRMYVAHVLDHDRRLSPSRDGTLDMQAHHALLREHALH